MDRNHVSVPNRVGFNRKKRENYNFFKGVKSKPLPQHRSLKKIINEDYLLIPDMYFFILIHNDLNVNTTAHILDEGSHQCLLGYLTTEVQEEHPNTARRKVYP